MMIVVALLYIFLFSVLMNVIGGKSEEEITYSKFISMLEAGEIESVEIDTDRIYITAVDTEKKSIRDQAVSIFFYMPTGGRGSVRYYTGKVEEDDTLTARLLDAGVEVQGKVVNVGTMILSFFMSYVFPLLLMWGLFSLLFRRLGRSGGGIFNVGKSNAKVYVQKETGVTFKDVAGEDEAKESLVEVVDFLHNPDKYSKIGAKLPKGALLVGPPGTGKTLLAKAVAGEAHVPFFSLSGSDFIELYVGVGASRVRDLFKEATKNAPCIIFIDEIDAIGRSRDSKYGGGNEEREQTLNQLLSEMDGFDTSKGILVLGATNRPEILDKALLRPGRFDRRIIVDKPDLKGRVEILKVHAKDVNLDETVDLDEIALATSGAVGADLANMINEGAIMAVQNGRSSVSQKDLFAAVEQVLVGKEKKDRIMSKKEREIVSYHEVGHALISALQKNSEPIQKITIVPRTMGALGYVMNVPEEEKYLETKAELHDRLVSLLGGRAAEEIVFGDVTTGAANDIEKATSIAQNMVTRFGMSERFGLMGLATIESQYLDGSARYTCSDRTVADIDSEIMAILRQCYEEAKTMLSENRDVMEQLAKHLIEKETISGKEFMKIFREIKGLPEPEEEAEDTAAKKADGGAPDQGSAGIAGYDRYVTDSTANSEQMKTRERIGEAIRNGGEDHAEGQESYLGRNVDVTVDETSGETPGNPGIAGQTFAQPVPSNAGTEGQTPVQDVPQNTKDTSAEEKPRWTPPSPGPERDREGAPRGRFSDTPFDSL
ncbi:MAG: ATP-dependent zinc metalloprotease FtsH [Lachnospiraceae bacterium]|nr:ATP-dependent zinc metalloprotease FtsH [Lachnospiraceae bacterium]